ncbi:30S ribosomal protein S13 [Corynebacterium diphtheriae]|nr:30S ribosomal protein S13 [Corynebacterium diphtheriae]SNW31879.1 30S ribosomal protein S13 [Corynebacterium belfantii]SUY73553.1 30S ribosomal protein S13 [Corynebacterium diphtheriae bv. mitis]CAB0491719.1 30S ribosomal protein S13 [Corynebacterium diphtheriae]CAB0492537.1 30S ribosomal protein S13 [Corynebacterium diphtheriae]
MAEASFVCPIVRLRPGKVASDEDEHGENHRNNRKGTALMARLAGVDLPRNKRMEVALTYIYGIGPARAAQLLEETGISPDLRTDNLTDEQVSALRDVIEATWKVEGDLRRQVQADIRRKIEIGCYQGLRHRRGLPVRGQRTKTNARTRKGPKKTIAGKKK